MGSAGQVDPQPVFVNKVLLAHGHTRPCAHCLCLLSCYEGRVVVTETTGPTKLSMAAAYKMESQDDTIWNKGRTRKVKFGAAQVAGGETKAAEEMG